jgi:hypothetical protein
MQQRFKGQAGMGGRGKNKPKNQTVATRRKVRTPKIPKAQVPGVIESPNPRKRNQKNNQRKWHDEKAAKIRKANRVPENSKLV